MRFLKIRTTIWKITIVLMMLGFVGVVIAQDNTDDVPVKIFLLSDVSTLQTGEYYTLNVFLDAQDVWSFSFKVAYDPSLVYVVGTVAGSPFRTTDVLNQSDGAVLINRVRSNTVELLYSLIAPAEQTTYGDTIATFQIYPLQAGTTTLRILEAQASRVFFRMEDDQRLLDSQEQLATGGNQLILTIEGDTVTIPEEATPTPMPESDTATSVPGGGMVIPPSGTEIPPTAVLLEGMPTPTPLTLLEEIPEEASNLPLIAVVFIGVGLLGLGLLFFFWQRRAG